MFVLVVGPPHGDGADRQRRFAGARTDILFQLRDRNPLVTARFSVGFAPGERVGSSLFSHVQRKTSACIVIPVRV